jgi:integrase
LTYWWQGKTVSEALGWEGETIRDEDEAYDIYRELRRNQDNKTPPFTLKERNEQREQAIQAKQQEEQVEKTRNTPFEEIITARYLPYIQANRRNQKAVSTEMGIYKLWIKPVIGDLPLSKIAQLPHMEAIKARMKEAGKSPRTIRYALDIVRQVFNFADIEKIYQGKNPAAGPKVKRPHEDNRRNRSLAETESEMLLAALLKHSQDVHDMCLLSLQAGLRFGEVAALRWIDVDIHNGQGHLKDTKSNKNRPFFLTDSVKAMFARRKLKGVNPEQLVFPDKNGREQEKISKTFQRVVDDLFNKDVNDRRERVVFHTLRRTFATWLLNQGTSIFHIQKLLGHADITTTTRYLDADHDSLKQAVMKLQNR